MFFGWDEKGRAIYPCSAGHETRIGAVQKRLEQNVLIGGARCPWSESRRFRRLDVSRETPQQSRNRKEHEARSTQGEAVVSFSTPRVIRESPRISHDDDELSRMSWRRCVLRHRAEGGQHVPGRISSASAWIAPLSRPATGRRSIDHETGPQTCSTWNSLRASPRANIHSLYDHDKGHERLAPLYFISSHDEEDLESLGPPCRYVIVYPNLWSSGAHSSRSGPTRIAVPTPRR